MKLPNHSSARARAGFSLLELIVVMSIIAILAGAAIPVARRAIDHAARKATRSELDSLGTATVAFFEDTDSLPRELSELVRDPGLRGWTGPYLGALGRDLATGADSALVDGWSRAYRVEAEGASMLSITSPGADRVFGGEDDLALRVDVTPVRRARTLEQLRTINAAIERYNAAHLVADPLPLDYGELLAKLVSRGYLPTREPWALDGWGQAFEAAPPSAAPVVRVASRSMRR